MEEKLKIAWKNDAPKRFVPQSLNGGSGWRVFDRKEKKFLEDADLLKISIENLRDEIFAN